MNLDVRRLRLLRELDARGTIAAVADAFSLSPSAVSQQLAQLERETAVQLLERVGRGVRLTPAARSILGHVDGILAQLGEVETTLARVGTEPSGRVTLTTFQSAGIHLVPHALTLLERDAPQVRVEVVESEPETALPALAAGRVDLVLAEDYLRNPRVRDPRLDRQELSRDPILVALPAAHPLAASGEPVSLGALADEPWAFTMADTFYAAMATRACNELGGFSPDVRHRANDLTVILALVAAGHAVALVPELIGADRSDIALREVADRPLYRWLYSSSRRSSTANPAVASVRAALAQAVDSWRDERYGDAAAASSSPAPADSSLSASSRPSADGSSSPATSRSLIQAEPSGMPT
jgi:DNA-binding transcriptional LysR family regulator